MESQIDHLMDQIRAAAAHLVGTTADLAAITGLHKNTLARLFDKSWKPRPDTIAKLERLLLPSSPIPLTDTPGTRKQRGGRRRSIVLREPKRSKVRAG
jgi:lambda repressor-like predicted transcriptional regulator